MKDILIAYIIKVIFILKDIFNFPILTFFGSYLSPGRLSVFILGLLVNCSIYSLLIERIISFVKNETRETSLAMALSHLVHNCEFFNSFRISLLVPPIPEGG